MSGVKSNRYGFTFLELVVAIALLALLATIVIPNLGSLRPEYERTAFTRQLNALMNVALTGALQESVVHQVFFDLKEKKIRVLKDSGRKDSKGEVIFVPIDTAYVTSTLALPEAFMIKNFYIEGNDEMNQKGRARTDQVWFFVMPSGLAQTVVINMRDTHDTDRSAEGEIVAAVLNPFTAQFKYYDTLQKP